jgi:hypothetical protein
MKTWRCQAFAFSKEMQQRVPLRPEAYAPIHLLDVSCVEQDKPGPRPAHYPPHYDPELGSDEVGRCTLNSADPHPPRMIG